MLSDFAYDVGHDTGTLPHCFGLLGGVAKDEQASVSWHQRAATSGNAQGQTKLGMAYHLGRGIEKDSSKALFWIKKAAEQGEPSAKLRLPRLSEK